MRRWLGFSWAVALTVVLGCGDDDGGTPDAGSDASTAGDGGAAGSAGSSPGSDAGGSDSGADAGADGSFVIGPNGGSRTLTLPGGDTLRFEFPASAAGERITLRSVDPATLDSDEELGWAIEMLPHGLLFEDPVRVEPEWDADPRILVTFADADSSDYELLASTSDQEAFELEHFSYLGSIGSPSDCPGVLGERHERIPLCCPTGDWVSPTCVLPAPDCMTLVFTGHCEVPPPASFMTTCGTLPGYYIEQNMCADAGPNQDSGVDAGPDAGDEDGGAGDGGGSSGSGGGGTGGTGPVGIGGCPQIGQYSVAVTSGTCGDLSTSAPRQRLDGFDTCNRYFEFDSGGGAGVASGVVVFDGSGVTNGLAIDLGSGAYTCTGTVSSSMTVIDLACQGASTCSLQLVRTGDL